MTGFNQGYEFRKRLGAEATGINILEFLTQRYPGIAPQEWLNRIESGCVLLNGFAANREALLSSGQVLSWMRPPWKEPEAPLSFAILYHDDFLLGVAKPEGLPTMPGGGQFMEHTLLALVRRHFPNANPLHRLGRGTSGVVLFARTSEASARVSQGWGGGRILKVYRALASGSPALDEFDIDIPIGPIPHPILRTIHAASTKGKPAHSHVKVIERREEYSLIEVQITTGRPHQIRIHMAAAGHPLVGDPLYGIGGIPAENSRVLPGDLGYHLHSMLLGFPHPVTNEWTEIACAPPPLLRCSGSNGF